MSVPADRDARQRPALSRWKSADGRDRVDRFGAGLLYWAPVWLPTIVVLPLLLQGLVPVLAKGRRLDAAEVEVRTWEAELAEVQSGVELERRKLADPIYRERVRKVLATVPRLR